MPGCLYPNDHPHPVPGPGSVKCAEGKMRLQCLSAVGLGRMPHVQSNTRTNPLLRTYPVSTLGHLTVAPVAVIYRMQ